MSKAFTVQDRATGEVVYAYMSDEAVDWPEYPFALFNHIPEKEHTPQAPDRVITRLAYLRRFTQSERVAIREAAQASMALADYLALLELAQEVDLDDPDTAAGVNALVAAGLLTPERGAEVLA